MEKITSNSAYSPYIYAIPENSVFYGINKYNMSDSIDSVSFTHSSESNEIRNQFELVKSHQGIVGKSWDKIKNILNSKSGSDYVNKQFDKYKNGLITEKQLVKSVNKYIKGQTRALDFVADWGATMVGLGAFAVALPAVATCVPAALGIAAISGAIFKIGTKAIDAKTGNREYKTLPYDLITGAINGFLSPIVTGIGNAVVKNTAEAIGLNVVSKATTPITYTAKTGVGKLICDAATYPKQIISAKLVDKAIPKTIGVIVKGVSKFGLSMGLREYSFAVLSRKQKNKKATLMMKIMSKINPDFKVIDIDNDKIDFSNNVYTQN